MWAKVLRFILYTSFWVLVWYFVLDFVLGLVLPLIQGRHFTTEVPELIGEEVEVAKVLARKRDLVVVVDSFVPSLNYPKGVIVSQEPRPGSVVKRGRKVFVNVSAGAQGQLVPDLVGMNLSEAVRSLADLGFEVETKPIYSLDEEPGYILRMEPPGGSLIPVGSKITLFYSELPPDTLLEDTLEGGVH